LLSMVIMYYVGVTFQHLHSKMQYSTYLVAGLLADVAGVLGNGLQVDLLGAPHHPRGGDQHLGLAVLDATYSQAKMVGVSG
jgi:hypothetical protein